MNARNQNMVAFRGGRIGSQTIPLQRIAITADAIWLQRLLTDKPRSKDFPVGLALVVVAAFLVILKLLGGWPA